ncbi:MAG: Rieske 2Fe-2S domain-containing protein [Pseudomonadota bacterium]
MSVKYQPVQWNRFKNRYNAVVLAMVFAYLGIFLGFGNDLAGHALNPDGAIHTARAFGSCAFLMLTVILCIGPLARLDQRFLPLLYNRRHFGVLTFVVALTHVMAVSNWYFAFSPTPMLEAMLSSNVSYRQYLGFPFEALGMFALLSLAALAFTSHDFWLKFLTPPIWKAIHFSIYPAYAALVGHVALGALQDETNTAFAIAVVISAFTVCALHALAAFVEVKRGVVAAGAAGDYADWQVVGSPAEIAEGEAKVICLASGGRAAIFRHEGAFSAISNACAHQNGPLGEGRILKGCVTCPWHGFQYDVRNGRSPAPFTEMIPTYNLALHEGQLLIDPTPNPPGTPTEAIPAPEVAS